MSEEIKNPFKRQPDENQQGGSGKKLEIKIGAMDGEVIIDFGEESITQLRLTPDEAMNLGRILFQKADAIKFGN